MDGIRGYWTGETLLSRHGNVVVCPEWYTSALPKTVTLDGELWMGQGTTHEDVHKVLRANGGDWSKIGYYLIDLPSSTSGYEQRMKELEAFKPILPSHVHVIKIVQCTGTEHLYQYLNSITTARGEGVMVREPLSLYVPGLTPSLLKVKVISQLFNVIQLLAEIRGYRSESVRSYGHWFVL